MNTKVRAYCYRESSDCFLPRDVLDALGAPPHQWQGRLIVFARTNVRAHLALADVDLSPRATRDLAVGHGNDVDALVTAGMGGEGNVWALPKQGHAVASVFREHSGRSVVRVGEIKRQDGVAVFVSEDEPEQVTDAMVTVGADAARAQGVDVDRETVWAILEAALNAKEDALPRN